MDKQVVNTNETPTVEVEVEGDLTVKGWDERQVVARSLPNETMTVDHRGEVVSIRCTGNCSVRVPLASHLQIREVGGHASIKSLEGELAVEEISGNLALRSVGMSRIDRVSGSLSARNVAGDLRLKTVEGSATLRDVQGDLIVEDAIHGSLTLNDVDGEVQASAHGSITAHLDPTGEKSYRLEADGSLFCSIPADSSVTVTVARAASLSVKIAGVQAHAPAEMPYSLTLGEGQASLSLAASGGVVLSSLSHTWEVEEIDVGEDIETITETITRQIEAHLEMLEHQLDSQLDNLSSMVGASGLSPEVAERIRQRAQQAGQRAQVRAQEKLRRAQEKLQRKLEAARRRAELRAQAAERAARDRRRRPEPVIWPFARMEAASEPVSEEERLMILHLLEQKKITVEEAEQLLAALEGKSA